MTFAIPPAIVHALRDPVPIAANFTAMTFIPAETKAWFAVHFLRFASSDFPEHHLTDRFHRQLMRTFGLVPHYGKAGFWSEYFTTTAGKIEFIGQVLHHPCQGDGARSFSDVEREIGRRLRHVDLLGFYRDRARLEREAAGRHGAATADLKASAPSLPALARASRARAAQTGSQFASMVG